MQLHWIDWLIILLSLLVCFVPALFVGKRSGKGMTEFFVSGRAVPWWLAGLSMVATTFASDTPNLVTDIVRNQGVAGNWCWWAFAITGILTVFFYAQLWRRSGVMTDLEFYEVRYSGKPAQWVRGFRAVYLGFFFNCIIMAETNLAACKIAAVLFGLDRWTTLLSVGLLNVVFAATSGLWGVLIIDMIQFFIMISAIFALAYFAVELPQVAGLSGLVEKVSALHGPGGINYLDMLPDFTNFNEIAVAVFIMPIAVQWWAVWYPGAEPGGGSFIAQRMLASKTDKDALLGTLFFNLAHYVLRPWPWILVALASLIVFPQLSDIREAFPNVDASLIGHDIAYPAMFTLLPAGWLGLMVAGMIAANSSTILTLLNWGASYLVHDFYQRFVVPQASERHYVTAARIATVLLFLCSGALTFFLDTAKTTFDIVLQVGAGTGLIYLVRWFWWRVNAWSEIVAMVASFAVSAGLLVLRRFEILECNTHVGLLITVIITTICWLAATYLAPPSDRKTLIAFYKKVRPFGPGWTRIRLEAGISKDDAAPTGESIPLGLLGWFSGCTAIWASLFAAGNFLFGRPAYAVMLTILFVISGTVLLRVVNRLWSSDRSRDALDQSVSS